MPTRGCPFRCTYCYNRTLNERYRPFRAGLRARSPELAVDDILAVIRRWGGRMVWLIDANVVAHRRWLEAFLLDYRRRVGLPFFCKLRPEQASEKTVRLLVQGGCTAVGVGIECDSERLRGTVLGRRVSDTAILDGCRRLKGAGLRVMAFNMLGIPGETIDDALRTVALNAACRVDYGGAIVRPTPSTAICLKGATRGRCGTRSIAPSSARRVSTPGRRSCCCKAAANWASPPSGDEPSDE